MLFAYIVHQMANMLGFFCLPWKCCSLGRAGRTVGAKCITQNSMGLIFAIYLGTGNQICKTREYFIARQGSWGAIRCHGNEVTLKHFLLKIWICFLIVCLWFVGFFVWQGFLDCGVCLLLVVWCVVWVSYCWFSSRITRDVILVH